MGPKANAPDSRGSTSKFSVRPVHGIGSSVVDILIRGVFSLVSFIAIAAFATGCSEKGPETVSRAATPPFSASPASHSEHSNALETAFDPHSEPNPKAPAAATIKNAKKSAVMTFDSELPLWVYQLSLADHDSFLLEKTELGRTPTKCGKGVRIPLGALWCVMPLSDDLSADTLAQLEFDVKKYSIPALSIPGRNRTAAILKRIKHLPSVRALDLERARIDGSEFRALKGASNIETLILNGCRGEINEALTQLPPLERLRRVYLGSASVSSGALKELGTKQPALRELSLNKTRLIDKVLPFAQLKHIERLDLRGTLITSEQLTGIRAMQSLRELHVGSSLYRSVDTNEALKRSDLYRSFAEKKDLLSQMSAKEMAAQFEYRALIDDDGLRHIADMKNIVYLDLRNCFQITDHALNHVARRSGLRVLRLPQQVSDDAVNSLHRLPSLKVVDLRNTNVTDGGFAKLAALENLEALDLGGCRHLSDEIFRHLLNSPNLEVLFLNADFYRYFGISSFRIANVPRISDKAVRAFLARSRLRVLSLENCSRLTDAALQTEKPPAQLRELILAGTRVTPAGIASFLERSSLRELHVDHINLTAKKATILRDRWPNTRIQSYVVLHPGNMIYFERYLNQYLPHQPSLQRRLH